MIAIEAICTTCGHDFTPAPDAFRRGTWRTCTRCRDGPGGEVSGVIEADSRCSQAQINGPTCQPILSMEGKTRMSSQLSNPTTSMTPGQHQALANARTSPIGSASDAAATLADLDTAHGRIIGAMRSANRRYNETTSLPEMIGQEVRTQVEREAEAQITQVETASRVDLAVLTARSQAIVSQLADASSEPSFATIPDDVLDGALRFVPLIQSQLAGQPLTAIAKRIKSAVIRDDASELLALAMILNPILAGKIDNPGDDDERYLAYELKDIVKQVTSKWRDRSLDGVLGHAQDVARKLVDLDHQILKNYAERTGDPDPYGYLTGQN